MIKNMKRVVLLHGNGSSHGTDNWFPYIKSAVESLDVECAAPDLPDNVLARKKYWFPYFKNSLKLGSEDIIIGHSSGALAILKYAEENEIGASILVGTYHTDLGYEDEKTSGYFDTPWDWKKINLTKNGQQSLPLLMTLTFQLKNPAIFVTSLIVYILNSKIKDILAAKPVQCLNFPSCLNS
jgi:uncharacterized protein